MRCTLEYSKVGEILLLNHTSKGITGISIKISLLQIIVKGVDFNEVEKQQCDIVCKWFALKSFYKMARDFEKRRLILTLEFQCYCFDIILEESNMKHLFSSIIKHL